MFALVLVAGCGFQITAGGTSGDDQMPGEAGPDGVLPDGLLPDGPMLAPACAQLALGSDHTCALRDGNVYCWGQNAFGERGGGSPTTPVSLPSPTIDLASSKYSTCAAAMDGSVRCWGYNDSGQIGDGTTTTRTTPAVVVGMQGAVQVGAARSHGCARRANGTIRCWGSNSSGQFGDGTTMTQLTATADVMNLSGMVGMAFGGSHVCARDAAGAAYCWGSNSYGQLGDGTTDNALVPIPAPVSGVSWIGGASFSSGTAGAHTCAIVSGAVRCWGDNQHGQLGDGSQTSSVTPVTAVGISDAVEVAMGRWHVCALGANGRVKCWGNNPSGEVGSGTSGTEEHTPVDVGLSDVLHVGAGGYHTCAITASRQLYCWGYNASGQLGFGGGSRDRPTLSFALCP